MNCPDGCIYDFMLSRIYVVLVLAVGELQEKLRGDETYYMRSNWEQIGENVEPNVECRPGSFLWSCIHWSMWIGSTSEPHTLLPMLQSKYLLQGLHVNTATDKPCCFPCDHS